MSSRPQLQRPKLGGSGVTGLAIERSSPCGASRGRGGYELIGPEFHVAGELADERVRDSLRAFHDRQLLAVTTQDRAVRGSFVRRPVALVLATLSRRMAVLVRLLDECVAEDLGRRLAPTE
jgi:hypothetical protein